MDEASNQRSVGSCDERADHKRTGKSSDESDGAQAPNGPARGMARGGRPGGRRFFQLGGEGCEEKRLALPGGLGRRQEKRLVLPVSN